MADKKTEKMKRAFGLVLKAIESRLECALEPDESTIEWNSVQDQGDISIIIDETKEYCLDQIAKFSEI